MTNEEKTKYFMEEIKPEIIAMKEKCAEAGISFLAVAESEPSAYERIGTICDGASMEIMIVEMAVRAVGNVDDLMVSITAHARKYGHSSKMLVALGIPVEGEAMNKIINDGSFNPN